MSFSDEVKGLLDDFLRKFPSCSLIFLASSEGFALLAAGEEDRKEEFGAYFSSLASLIQKTFSALQLGELRSAILITEGGFCGLFPVNNSLSLGVVFRSKASYSTLFPTLRSMAERVRKMAEQHGL